MKCNDNAQIMWHYGLLLQILANSNTEYDIDWLIDWFRSVIICFSRHQVVSYYVVFDAIGQPMFRR